MIDPCIFLSLAAMVVMALVAKGAAEHEVQEAEHRGDDVSFGKWLRSFIELWALHGLIQMVLLVMYSLVYSFQWQNLWLLLFPLVTPAAYVATHWLLYKPSMEVEGWPTKRNPQTGELE